MTTSENSTPHARDRALPSARRAGVPDEITVECDMTARGYGHPCAAATQFLRCDQTQHAPAASAPAQLPNEWWQMHGKRRSAACVCHLSNRAVATLRFARLPSSTRAIANPRSPLGCTFARTAAGLRHGEPLSPKQSHLIGPQGRMAATVVASGVGVARSYRGIRDAAP